MGTTRDVGARAGLRASSSLAREIKVFGERDPAAAQWGDAGAEVVIESTGVFTDRENAAKNIEAGVREAVIVVSLAKRIEEVFMPGRPQPLGARPRQRSRSSASATRRTASRSSSTAGGGTRP
ncbi:MAG: hypothetical protein M3417_14215 [Actinomycetota bacterium]|nr:hypothetical protein [Actinomycetota bacterium]